MPNLIILGSLPPHHLVSYVAVRRLGKNCLDIYLSVSTIGGSDLYPTRNGSVTDLQDTMKSRRVIRPAGEEWIPRLLEYKSTVITA